MSFSLNVFNFLLCRFETMARWIDVRAQFNDGEPQRLNVRCLSVTLRGLKDELNAFNQGVNPGDTRGWKTFGIIVRRSTRGEYHSMGWNYRTTKTWRTCFGSTSCSSGSICV